jgi:hypothetical protein
MYVPVQVYIYVGMYSMCVVHVHVSSLVPVEWRMLLLGLPTLH